jgi:quinol monooxygenase YgiN
MVQMTVRLTAASGRAPQLVEALHALMRETRRRAGCSDAHIAVDVDEAHAFWYCEDWQDERALEDELRSETFSQLLALLETSTTPPVLEFRTIAETRGLDYVSAVREQPQLPTPPDRLQAERRGMES